MSSTDMQRLCTTLSLNSDANCGAVFGLLGFEVQLHMA